MPAESDGYVGGLSDNGSCCQPLFNKETCLDGSIGLYNRDGRANMFFQWLGLRKAEAIAYRKAIIPYLGAAEGVAAGSPTSGVPASICAYGNKVESGRPCFVEVECFGHIKRSGKPQLSGGQIPYCKQEKVYTVDNIRLTDDRDYHEAVVSRALVHDFYINAITGVGTAEINGVPNPNNPEGVPSHWGIIPLLNGDAFDAGYGGTCDWNKAHCLDWNSQPLVSATPQAGITLNGVALADKFTMNLMGTLDSIWIGVRQLFDRMPHIEQSVEYGDIALVVPSTAIECILEALACRLYCDPTVTRIDNGEARAFYHSILNAGLGYGEITLRGNVRVPIIPFDLFNHETGRNVLENVDGTVNMMLLWRGNSAQRLIGYEYNDLAAGNWDSEKTTRDDGAFQMGIGRDDDCSFLTMRHEWRIDFENLCLQTYIKNIACDSIEPCEPTYDEAAVCD